MIEKNILSLMDKKNNEECSKKYYFFHDKNVYEIEGLQMLNFVKKLKENNPNYDKLNNSDKINEISKDIHKLIYLQKIKPLTLEQISDVKNETTKKCSSIRDEQEKIRDEKEKIKSKIEQMNTYDNNLEYEELKKQYEKLEEQYEKLEKQHEGLCNLIKKIDDHDIHMASSILIKLKYNQ